MRLRRLWAAPWYDHELDHYSAGLEGNCSTIEQPVHELGEKQLVGVHFKIPDLVNVLNTTRNNTGRELEVAIMILLSYLTISLSIRWL